jgi:uncharacterized protein (DUF433 family)
MMAAYRLNQPGPQKMGLFASTTYNGTMEQLPASSPLSPWISVDPERLSGEPVFRGTRVPVKTLFDYISANHDLDTFLDHFEGVTREQAIAVLDLAARGLLSRLGEARAA